MVIRKTNNILGNNQLYQDWKIDNFWLLIRYSQHIHIQMCRFIIINNNFQTHTICSLFIYLSIYLSIFCCLLHTNISCISGWCYRTHHMNMQFNTNSITIIVHSNLFLKGQMYSVSVIWKNNADGNFVRTWC
jgi:hypothetical protein